MASLFKILLLRLVHDSIVWRPHYLPVFEPHCMTAIESRILLRRLIIKFNEKI